MNAHSQAPLPPAEWPELHFPDPPQELFDPAKHFPAGLRYAPPECEEGEAPSPGAKALEAPVDVSGAGMKSASPPLPLFLAAKAHPELRLIPRPEDCFALWDRYRLPPHIRAHCRQVANMALAVARAAQEAGHAVSPKAVHAAALLHDIAKGYSVAHGGSHAQLGAAWTMRETRNGALARAVLFHVYWPFDETRLFREDFVTGVVLYADKRVRHDALVTLDERFRDLFARYGHTQEARSGIHASHEQGKRVEAGFSRLIGANLDEYTADNGRLVHRA